VVANGKDVREFDGRQYVLERGIQTDWAIVKAWRGDRLGNLQYRLSARNFNPLCAMAGRNTVAEVEELVEVGAMAPDQIDTPGIFVQHVVVGKHEKRIERRTTRPRAKC
jgi:3-oxoacid CoA-transferase subunit A